MTLEQVSSTLAGRGAVGHTVGGRGGELGKKGMMSNTL